MLIRCEKCSTLYELDDRLLPPQGAPVQCSKCQFVFKAYPGAPAPQEAAESPSGFPAERAGTQRPGTPTAEAANEPLADSAENAPEPRPENGDVVREGGALAANPGERPSAATPRPPRPPPQAQPSSSNGAAAPAASASSAGVEGDAQFTPDGRRIRKVPFPTEQPGPRTVMVPASSGRTGAAVPRWAVPVAVVVLIAIAIAVWLVLGHDRHGGPPPRQPAGHSRVTPDTRTPVAPRGPDAVAQRPAAKPAAAVTAAPGTASDDPARQPAPDPYEPSATPPSATGVTRADASPVSPDSAVRN